ncbi:hypothetical protein [Aurantibacillus circumpalustris]|uniref:hypothetical protein n=1 Tax=Aurantibacillus circumpalustris TaxID=3036359 RepID=UPI00295C172C|nr:hypothetical protein [Aurantibacillus circumpalustris]
MINLSSNVTIFNDPNGSSTFGNTYTGNQSDITYTLKELRSDKFVLVSQYSINYSKGYGYSYKSELTFEE